MKHITISVLYTEDHYGSHIDGSYKIHPNGDHKAIGITSSSPNQLVELLQKVGEQLLSASTEEDDRQVDIVFPKPSEAV